MMVLLMVKNDLSKVAVRSSNTLQGTNISHPKVLLSRGFSFFPRRDLLVSWRVYDSHA